MPSARTAARVTHAVAVEQRLGERPRPLARRRRRARAGPRPATSGRAPPEATRSASPAARRGPAAAASTARSVAPLRSGCQASFVTAPAQTRLQSSASVSRSLSPTAATRSEKNIAPRLRRASRIGCDTSDAIPGPPTRRASAARVEGHAAAARADPDDLAAGASARRASPACSRARGAAGRRSPTPRPGARCPGAVRPRREGGRSRGPGRGRSPATPAGTAPAPRPRPARPPAGPRPASAGGRGEARRARPTRVPAPPGRNSPSRTAPSAARSRRRRQHVDPPASRRAPRR